jgi:hypothetical protein
MLQGTEFQTAEELLMAVVQILSNVPLETIVSHISPMDGEASDMH